MTGGRGASGVAVLRVEGLDAGYGGVQVLRGVALDLRAGEVHCLLGRNGAGKTTLLKAIMGLVRPTAGRVLLEGWDLARLPAHRVPRLGVAYVPQGRRLFAELTVAENLEIGLMARPARRAGTGGGDRAVRERTLALFPVLGERLGQRAGTLSGGEQQMLAMARALCLEPRVLLLDEPTEGLQPSMVTRIRDVVAGLRGTGVATLLVEQRVEAVHAVADRVSFLENGQMRETIAGAELDTHSALFHRYVGVGT
jgi:branched-chain amino acid transport system ATP-binding protein